MKENTKSCAEEYVCPAVQTIKINPEAVVCGSDATVGIEDYERENLILG